MQATEYIQRRGQLEEYFDRTASRAWARLTSEEPVGRIRATIRAGRDRMAAILLGYLPPQLHGLRVLDAGCGTGTLSTDLARMGAEVVGVDISQSLVDLARTRADDMGLANCTFHVGDMLDPALGEFDWIIAFDSLIHYPAATLHELLVQLCGRARMGIGFTFAPRTPLLSVMHTVGKAFPRGNRSPDIRPISERDLRRRLAAHETTAAFEVAGSERVSSGFYTSHAMELRRR